ncbi:glycosyltransferase [Candidatus Woesearchaeota archaeon]|jgi:glycosyltransferase involved in cell wall biosynthesis|nr:glycosyltransferase [Candidatus Woesearchaeota archaeon]MBT4336444.1 glycosyltransferase [Candidatus Woesearchaeota archaeon]MBT4469857.1 glycosyltransferase [Candidatus Woesearchaeota archaeon]MBT6744472.1 glycosyltransferase [Candidatus Woesearchaeota archaeon]
MDPKISIIIPAHNEENYIRKTLHSIKNQTYQNYETVVVANGCTDGTEDLVKKRTNDKTKFFSISEANVSKARNFGSKFANGEIFLFLDADTTLEEDSLQKIKDQFTEEYSVATTRAIPDDQKMKFKFALGFKNFYHRTKLYQGCSGALICRKEDFHAVNGYPEIVVKEHRKLIIDLKRHTKKKFKCLDTNVTTSMRRFQQWGLTKATFFWIKEWGKNYVSDLKDSDYEKVR